MTKPKKAVKEYPALLFMKHRNLFQFILALIQHVEM